MAIDAVEQVVPSVGQHAVGFDPFESGVVKLALGLLDQLLFVEL